MFRPVRTKRDLLDCIVTGHASVELIPITTQIRVAAGGEPDRNAGIWLSALQVEPRVVDDRADVYARIQNRDVRLTETEIQAVVRYVAEAMRQRGRVQETTRSGSRPSLRERPG
jgi:hypothetical protein